MQTKLTLRLDNKLIIKAKKYSNNAGKSVSQIVADYFAALDAKSGNLRINSGPITKKLLGALKKSPKVSEADYHRYLDDKYL